MHTQALIDEIARITGETGNTTYRTTILRYLNRYYKNLALETEDPALIKETIISVPKYISDGTVEFTASSLSGTGTGTAFTTDHIGWHMRLDSTNETFKIDFLTAVDQKVKLEQAYAGTTGSYSYKAYKLRHLLPVDFSNVISMTQNNNPIRMQKRSIEQMDELIAVPYFESGAPQMYVIWDNASDYDGVDATARSEMLILPAPDNLYQVRLKYKRKLTDLTDSATVFPVFDGTRYDDFLIDMTSSRIFLDKEDERWKVYKSDAGEQLMIIKSFFEDKSKDDDRFQFGSRERL